MADVNNDFNALATQDTIADLNVTNLLMVGDSSTGLGMLAGVMDSSGDAPYTVTLGPGAGSGTSPAPSYTMKGSLVSGTFTVQTGNIAPPMSIEVVATFAPPSAFNELFNTCAVVFTPANIDTLYSNVQWVELDTSGPTPVFNLMGALFNNMECKWHYIIIGNIQGT